MSTAIRVEAEKRLITGEELLAMSDIGPCELVEGELIQMSPVGDTHGAIELNIGAELRDFVREHDLGVVRVGEVGIYISRNPDTIRAADVLFIAKENYAGRRSKGFLDIAPDLVVEVLSPSDTWHRVNQKLQEYFNIGVKMIWVVDSLDPQVYVYRSITDVRYFTGNDKLPGDEILPGLDLAVAALYVD
jgi:Uma2 family endonuclease